VWKKRSDIMPKDDEYIDDMDPLDDDDDNEGDDTELRIYDDDDDDEVEEPQPAPSSRRSSRRSRANDDDDDDDDDDDRGRGRSRSRRDRAPKKKGGCLGWLFKTCFVMLIGAAGGVAGAAYGVKFILEEFSNPKVSKEFKVLKQPVKDAVKFLDPNRQAPEGSDAPAKDKDGTSEKTDGATDDDAGATKTDDGAAKPDGGDASATPDNSKPLDNPDDVDPIGDSTEPVKPNNGVTENDLQLD
jgi:hypothetical protein